MWPAQAMRHSPGFSAIGGVSNAKARAPFGAACPHDCATAALLHPDPKSVRALAACAGRLISAFHGIAPVPV